MIRSDNLNSDRYVKQKNIVVLRPRKKNPNSKEDYKKEITFGVPGNVVKMEYVTVWDDIIKEHDKELKKLKIKERQDRIKNR